MFKFFREIEYSQLPAPSSVVASWPKPNYIDPPTQGLALQWASIALSAIGLLIVVLRCYTRIFLTRAFGLDDAFIIFALALCISLSAVLIWGIRDWCLGYHVWDLPSHSIVDHRKGTWIASYLATLASFSIRISILLFYRRLSVSFPRGFLIASWIGIAYNAGLMLSLCLANTFICWPIEGYWDRYDTEWRSSHQFTCGNEAIALPISGILNVIGDLYCTVLPLVLVTTLKLPQRQKIALYLLFGLGFFVCGAGVARTTILTLAVWTTYDFTWKIYDMWIWYTVELYVGILVACAPALKPLLRMVMGSRFLGYNYTYGSRDYATPTPANINGKAQYMPQGAVPANWNDSHYDTKNPAPVFRSSSRNEKEARSGKKRTNLNRTPSLVSNGSSTYHDQASIESFPRRSRNLRTHEPGSPIIEEEYGKTYSQISISQVDVDPPIFPASVVVRPLTRPNRSSQFIGDGLPSQEYNPHRLKLPKSQDDTLSNLSSPAPADNQYLTNDGWVELRPVKEKGGSVAAARLRANAQNRSRSINPLPKTKPMFDAESAHTVSFEPTPLPRNSPHLRTSDELTRLNYSDSSGASARTQGFSKFQLDLNESPVTALPRSQFGRH